jgi:hypothetical protein
MPRHSLASPKIVHQKNLRSRKGRSSPGLPFGSFMATAPCRRTALARLWAQLSSSPYRDQFRFQQSIDMPPASKSKGKLSIGCFFLCLNSTANILVMRPRNPREDGRGLGRNKSRSVSLCRHAIGEDHIPAVYGGEGIRDSGCPKSFRIYREWGGHNWIGAVNVHSAFGFDHAAGILTFRRYRSLLGVCRSIRRRSAAGCRQRLGIGHCDAGLHRDVSGACA